jgi:hypothetical protein
MTSSGRPALDLNLQGVSAYNLGAQQVDDGSEGWRGVDDW